MNTLIELGNQIGEGELLLPSDAFNRLKASVAWLAVQGDPRTPPGESPRYKDLLPLVGEKEAVRRTMLNPFDIHAEVQCPGNIALVRKAIPHGMYEMTALAREDSEEEAVTSIFGFKLPIRRSFLNIGRRFAEFAEGNELYPTLSWSFDPHTLDRPSAQSVKTYHLQLTARDDRELLAMKKAAVTLEELEGPKRLKRQFIDEFTVAFSGVLNDYFSAHPVSGFETIAPFSEDSCSNVRFRVAGGWENLKSVTFDSGLAEIHAGMKSISDRFIEFATIGNGGRWQRPRLDLDRAFTFIDSLEWMSRESNARMKHYFSSLRPHHLDKAEALVEVGLASHIYPVDGLCYGTAISRKNESVLVSIRPQLFGETGGTGLQYYDPIGVHVRMKRGSGMYSSEELARKSEFERACSAFIATSVEMD